MSVREPGEGADIVSVSHTSYIGSTGKYTTVYMTVIPWHQNQRGQADTAVQRLLSVGSVAFVVYPNLLLASSSTIH